ncbi:MAG: serine hydrolase [Tenuifilum sp.]|uniref:serine hydrolase domain-containing protein n=1 Tax=Tenuifilum sp. TaxID=2760880 RepID=UPI001B56B171|nr:serine hydrolase [Bacteroidales bacterium]HOK60884.1 serine hydrolase [Tenuifilum sp.]HOK85465.1 serine hydrolase [Tenuifilum sp.]HON70251.1 serine hydrolase [Tenuifilum sp.]HOU74386.1 serine hydrolase [Tenuifilum sp.]
MNWKRKLKVASVVVVVALAVYLALPQNHYIVRALIYQQVNIDDYKIFHNRTVKAGTPQPWRLHEKYNSYQLTNDQLKYFNDFRTVAFLVVKDTALLFESYWDGYGKDSYSNSFSMAKSIVSLLMGCALSDGYVKSIDEPVGNYLPEFAEGDKAKITIKHLLTMSSGLSWDESYSTLFSLTTQGYYGKNLPKLVLNQTVVKEPGKTFEYRSGDTQLLSLIIEKATGKTLADYASEKIWSKIGAEHDALWCLDRKDGVEKAFCCFNTNARDFARFGQLVLNGGRWNGEQIVPEEYLNESLTPASYLFDPETNKNVDFYGYQWWMINVDGYKTWYARGLLGQYIFVIPSLNAVVVRLGHVRNNNRIDGTPEDVYQYIRFGISIVKSIENNE